MSLLSDDDRLNAFDHTTRVGLARSAVGDRDAVMTSWRASALPGGGTAGNYRTYGEARSLGRLIPWSMVIKWFSPFDDPAGRTTNVDPSSRGYWKREWLLYQAPWFSELPRGLTAPRILGSGETSSTDAWLAMEDLSTFDKRPWSRRHFATLAHQTGQFNGAFLTGHRLPDDSWLSRHWLRDWSGSGDPITALDAATGNAAVSRIFSQGIVTELRWLWRTRDVLLQALDGLPETLCHQDLHPRNAFFRKTSKGEQAVVIDWAECGPGPVGADLAGLVGSSIFLLEAEGISPDDLESQCLEGYLAGLHDVGWRGSDQDVRFGYLASLVTRYLIPFTQLVVSLILSDKDHGWAEKVLGRTIDEFLSNYRTLLDFLEPRVERVRQAVRAIVTPAVISAADMTCTKGQ